MISASDLAGALGSLGVAPTDTLFVHAGTQAAARMAGRRPTEKLDTIIEGLSDAVPEGVLAMPTFTYSFTKGEAYDPARTPSTVGALGERFRTLEGVRRTMEPNFSCALRGDPGAAWPRRLFEPGDTDAFGDESIFGMLREHDAKLLFFGVGFDYCTYVHHVEQRLGVPYRYRKRFDGVIRVGAEDRTVSAHYFVRRLDEDVVPWFRPLAARLEQTGRSASRVLPQGPQLLLTDTGAVGETTRDGLAANPDFLLRRGDPAAADVSGAGTPLPGS